MQLSQIVRELYQQDAEAQRRYGLNFSNKLNKDLASIEGLPIDAPWKQLDEYSSLSYLLRELSPAAVLERLGPRFLVWTVVQQRVLDRRNDLLSAELTRSTDIDGATLEKARLAMWRWWTKSDTDSTVAQYRLLALHNDIEWNQDAARAILRKANPSTPHIDQYTFAYAQTQDDYEKAWERNWRNAPSQWPDALYRIYLDAPCGILLMRNGYPCAATSYLIGKEDNFLITQLQGVNAYVVNEEGTKYTGEKRPNHNLAGLRWKETLLSAAGAIATQLGYRTIHLQGAKNNAWVKPDREGKIHLSIEQAHNAYDAFAARSGFHPLKNGNWSRRIPNSIKRTLQQTPA